MVTGAFGPLFYFSDLVLAKGLRWLLPSRHLIHLRADNRIRMGFCREGNERSA